MTNEEKAVWMRKAFNTLAPVRVFIEDSIGGKPDTDEGWAAAYDLMKEWRDSFRERNPM